MKEITDVNAEGITYLDEKDNQQFIDFETCHQNNLSEKEKQAGSSFTDEDREFWKRAKYVGVRITFREPPALEFYTEPRIYFEFQTRENLYMVLSKIKETGWRTNDGE